MNTLKKTEFEAWLQGFQPKDIVGINCSPMDCPIARYLGSGTQVGPDWYRPQGRRKKHLPEWADNFVDTLDYNFKHHVWRKKKPVTAARALKTLLAGRQKREEYWHESGL